MDELQDTLIRCQVVRRKNDLLLVTWDEGERLMSAWVPPMMVEEEDQSKSEAVVRNPREGFPHGEDWTEFIPEPSVTPELIDRELKRRGIWTIADLQARPEVARHCLQRAYGLDLATLLRGAARKKKAE